MTTLFKIPLHGKDMKWDVFSGTGPGGQNRNRKKKCVRVRHLPSGAVGEGREFRSKVQNEKAAVKRLVAHKRFKAWVRVEASARLEGYRNIEDKVDKMMHKSNLRVEVCEDGEWVIG
jgi:protein subunit release factor A